MPVITPGTAPDMLLKLAVLANEYMMARLVLMCEGELVRLLDDDNATDLLQYAQHYSLEHLRQGCDLYICRHLEVLEAAGSLASLGEEAMARVRRAAFGGEPPTSLREDPMESSPVPDAAALDATTASLGAMALEDAHDDD